MSWVWASCPVAEDIVGNIFLFSRDNPQFKNQIFLTLVDISNAYYTTQQ